MKIKEVKLCIELKTKVEKLGKWSDFETFIIIEKDIKGANKYYKLFLKRVGEYNKLFKK